MWPMAWLMIPTGEPNHSKTVVYWRVYTYKKEPTVNKKGWEKENIKISIKLY